MERSTLAEFANKRLSIDVNAECAGRSAEEDGNAFDLRRELEKLRDFGRRESSNVAEVGRDFKRERR